MPEDPLPPLADATVTAASAGALELLVDGWEAAWSGRDARAFEPLCDPRIQYEDPLTRQPLLGVEELAPHAERLWSAFPDVRLERAGERLGRGRFVAAPCKLAGTHRGALEGLPASGRFLVIHCVLYCELRAGRLLRVRTFFDLYDAAVQVGVLPTHGTVGEKALMLLRGFGLRARGS